MPCLFLHLLEQQVLGLGTRKAGHLFQLAALILQQLGKLFAKNLVVGFAISKGLVTAL